MRGQIPLASRGGIRYVEGGFQDIDFPRCTIIMQDLNDSKKMTFRDVLRFQTLIFQYVLRFQDSSNEI